MKRAIQRWTRITILCALATAAVWVLAPDTPAQAGTWELGRAQAVAGKAWGYPCGGRPQIAYSDRYAGIYDAWVEFYEDAQRNPVPICTIYFSPGVIERASWERVCTLLLHEFGHLAGKYSHESDPASIMHESPRTDPRCAGRGRAYLGLPEPRTARLRAKYA